MCEDIYGLPSFHIIYSMNIVNRFMLNPSRRYVRSIWI